MRTPPRRGMTLIEVMTVILIIGVALGLLLPAIQASRYRSRGAQCVNNLLQLGLAMHNYHATNDVFPIGAMGRHGKGYPLSGDPTGMNNRRTWSSQILPFLDQQVSLYNAINFNLSFDDPANTTCARTQVAGYVCPMDPNVSSWIDAGRPRQRVRGNYAVNWGNTHFDQAAGPDPFAGPLGPASFGGAPFGYDVCYPITYITDGLSNTLLMSELLNPPPGADPSDRRGDLYSDDPNAAMFLGYSPPNATTPDQLPKVPGSRGCVASGPMTPCSLVNPAFNAARSLHPGGVNTLMGDGSVRFLKDSVNVQTWQSLSTSSGSASGGQQSY